MLWQINGDARALPIKDETVQCVVTSPPYYGLRNYQVSGQIGLEKTYVEYVAAIVQAFREIHRVLRKDGTCWLNIADSYASGKGTCHNPGGNTSSFNVHLKEQNVHPLDRGNKSTLAVVGLKPKDLIGIPWRVAFALQADGWYLRQDLIWHKCLSGGTRVYAKTQKGEMPTTIKDLVRLDPATVKLWNGKRWTQAVSWSETKRNGDEIELVLRSGERIGCTGNHVWPTTRGNVRADALAVGDVLQTCRLPEPDIPRRPSFIPDDIGWFIGLYIAEGSKSDGTIQIASNSEQTDRFHRLQTLAEMFDGYCFVANTGGKAATANINSPVLTGIIDAYVSGRTAKDKHLNVRCWKRSDDFLRAVLDGYLSGDGHHAVGRWRLGFCANDNLAYDLRAICARLGLSLRLKRTFHTCTNAKGGPRRFPGWRGEIRDTHRESGGEIVAIEKSRARKFWDITVEDDPHLFALASGVLTHNSNPMPESVTDRCTKAHEYLFLLSKSARYHFDAEAIADPAIHAGAVVMNDAGKNSQMGQFGQTRGGFLRPEGVTVKETRNRRSVWTIATQPTSLAHFATFPEALVLPCILAGSRPGDIVLDPFAGTGTVGKVALEHGRKAVMVDLKREYLLLDTKKRHPQIGMGI